MEITDIKVRPVANRDKLKAYVSLTFDNCFVVHELKIIEGTKGRFVAMPSKKLEGNKFVDIVHPIDNNVRTQIQQKVLAQYDKSITEQETV